MVIVGTLACFSKAQSDTYWHLAAGRAMVTTGRVMLTDEFSHTNFGAPWLNYEWLSQVVFFRIYQAGGMAALTALCAALAVGTCVLIWKLLRGPVADRLLLVAMALPLLTPGWSLRPQAFTMFLCLVVIHLLLRRWFWPLPVIFALWANLHGAVALGLVIVAADLVSSILSKSGYKQRALFAFLCFGATLLTPLGLDLWPEVLRSVTRSGINQITEWLPPGFTPAFALFWILAAALLWLALTRWAHLARQEDRTLVLVALFMLLLATRASRNVVPFGLVVAPAISMLLWRMDTQPARRGERAGVRGTLSGVVVLALSVLVAVYFVHRRWTSTPPPADWAPISPRAAAAIQSCPPPIYNHFDTGGFIIWFVPTQKVFLDSRHNPYPDGLLKAQREAGNPAALLKLLNDFGVRCAVLSPASRESGALRTLRWVTTYRDPDWVVMTEPVTAPQD